MILRDSSAPCSLASWLSVLSVFLFLLSCQLPPAGPELGRGSRFELLVLGVAQDGGLPHVGCNKPCCEAARREGRSLYPACLAVHDKEQHRLLLIEATPRVEPQLAMLHRLTATTGGVGRGRRPVDAVLITHAHIGHYVGLAQFGFEVASTKELPVYVSPRLAGFLRGNGPWSQLVEQAQIKLFEVQPGEPFQPLPGLEVTAVLVPHRQEFSDTVAFKLRGPERTVLFLPDVDSWKQEPGLLESLMQGVDLAFLDATFYDGRELPGRNMENIPHPLMLDSMERLASRSRERPGLVHFIHFNHSNPALHDAAIREQIHRRGFRLAEQGQRFDI